MIINSDGYVIGFDAGRPITRGYRQKILQLVREDGSNFETRAYGFEEDKEMVLTAVQTCGRQLQHAFGSARDDPDIIKAAFDNDVHSIYYIKKDLITREMALRAVKKHGHLLRELPRKFRDDYEIIMEALKSDQVAYYYVDYWIRDKYPEMAMLAVRERIGILEEVPEKFRNNRELIKSALRNHQMNTSLDYIISVYHIPEQFRKDKFIEWLAHSPEKRKQLARERIIRGVLENLRLVRKYHPQGVWFRKMVENDMELEHN